MSIARYPSFFIGIIIANKLNMYNYNKDKFIKTIAFQLMILVGILIIPLHIYFNNEELISNGWLFKPHIFMTTGLCIRTKIVAKVLGCFGNMSYEVYLLHGIFLGMGINYAVEKKLNTEMTGLSFMLISFVIAHIFHIINSKLSNKCITFFSKRTIKSF